jgi:hypothetical protein
MPLAPSSPLMTVTYDERLRLVRHVMHGHVYGHWLREGLEAGLVLLQEHGNGRWLSDDRENGPISAEDMAWLREDWEPRAVLAGWRVWALVRPTQVLGQMNMRRNVERVARVGVLSRVFDDVADAELWLAGLR